MRMPRKMSRRQLLAGLGGAGAVAALSPFVPLLRARGDDLYPTRVVVFMTMMGMSGRYPDPWKPSGGATDFRFPTGSILEPLTPFRDRITVIDGLTNQGAEDTNLAGGHPQGLGTALTGGRLIEGPGMVGGGARDWTARTFGPSIDQLIASRLGVRSMELGIDTSRSTPTATYKTRMSFRGPSEPVPSDFDPESVYERFFGSLDGTSESGGAERARRTHLLDYVRGDLAGLRARAGVEDRLKIDAHLGTLERIRAELAATAPATCVAPDLGSGTNLPANARMQMQLVKAAFECDLTRVATIMWGKAPHGWRFDWLDRPISAGFHRLSHAGPSDDGAQNDLIRANRWYAQQFHDFLALLDSVPEGDGTLLDHTLVLWASEVSNGNTHSFQNMPYVLAGGTHRIRTGQYLSFDGQPTNALMVSIAQAMGVDITTFGDPDYGSGPLPGLA